MRFLGWIIGGDKDDKKSNIDGHRSAVEEVPTARGWAPAGYFRKEVSPPLEPMSPVEVLVRKVDSKLEKIFGRSVTYRQRHEAHMRARAAFVETAKKVHGYTPVVHVDGGLAHPVWVASKEADARYALTYVWGRHRAA